MPIWSAEIKEIERLYDSIKGQSPELEKELERLIRTDDENIVLVYARRCLEVIVTDLCESELKRPRKTEPLQGIIDKLNREEKIPSHIFASMLSLNSLSTFGSHPKEFDPEQVKPVLNNLSTILKWYLKYKDTQSISKAKAEDVKYDIKEQIDTKENIRKPKKRLILLLSGLALVIVVVALFIFNIIGGEKQTEELEKSIAVLPFVNLSSDEEQVWFSDGITDIIISQLSKISDLRVLSRTSTLKYSKEQKSISEIGKELEVNFIIEGTVQRQENKMRISVQLIRVLNEGHLWADVYDRDWKDIFDVQSDIAQRIAEELKAVLTPEEKERFERTQTENPEAYNLYLQGRFFWNKRTEEGLKKSIEYFEKSVALDPEYALAYAGLADAYSVQAWWGWVPREKGNTKAKEMAIRALEIDNELAEAHATLGSLLCYSEWKWEEARKELIHAIELDPNYIIAHSYYSELLDILEQNEEARKHINLALELDPFFPLMHGLSAIYYYHEGKYKESLDECWKVEELAPDKMDNNWRMFFVYIKMGDDLNAIDVLQKIIQKDKLTAENAKNVKEVYNKSGIKGLLNWIIDLQLDDPYVFTLARSFVLLDKKNEALNVLENKLAENAPSIARINNDPDFDNLRSEPRFVAIIKKLGLSEYVKKE
jgi:TolB-like protein/Tfp pilus assembly protein PilF